VSALTGFADKEEALDCKENTRWSRRGVLDLQFPGLTHDVAAS
jgi:hypothetical protein